MIRKLVCLLDWFEDRVILENDSELIMLTIKLSEKETNVFKEEIQHKVVITIINKDNYCELPNKIFAVTKFHFVHLCDYRAPVVTKRLIEY